ncbi:hypothetical protein ACLQ26_15785 [Micromonospora sp. DT43]|uniref:hypothetical protein n=1 Tax=Micromonospora sp. DT43 TaxID=3393440 RepID=UPI003CEA1457
MSRQAWVLVVIAGILAIATLVGAVVLAVRLVRTRRLLTGLGAGGKVAFYGALIYTIFRWTSSRIRSTWTTWAFWPAR